MRKLLTAMLFLTFGVGTARAACTPFGSDDTGCMPSTKAIGSCEEKIAGNVATKLVLGIGKCHAKQVSAAFKGKAFDEETCESAAVTKFTSVSNTTGCPCVNTATIASLATSTLDANNHLVYCDPAGAAIDPTGDDTGNIPTTKAFLGCEAKLAKCVTLLVKGYVKCHQKAAKSFSNGKTFDEEGCETTDPKGPVIAYGNCVASLTGCQGCETANVATIQAQTDTALDGSNGLVFCESASGAFLDGAR
jgi:hypothetical protein